MTTGHQAVLQVLGCGDLETLIDPTFRDEFDLGTPGQYGIVVADVPGCIERLRAEGASEFLYANMAPPSWIEQGQPVEGVKVELAMGYTNHQQIELLGPGQGTNFYTDCIPDNGGPVLHHVCVFQKGLDELEQRLNDAGYPTVLAGDVGIKNVYTTRFRYFDTRERLGIFLEITEYLLFGLHTPPGERLIRWIARRQGRFAG